jgi:hypothetical protein
VDGSGTVEVFPLDWSGHVPDGVTGAVPGPRQAPDDADPDGGHGPAGAASPLARMVLARVRLRAVMPLDVVAFGAACPSCGRDTEWVQERQDTRVRSTIRCTCRP